jgi:hypothetical protein
VKKKLDSRSRAAWLLVASAALALGCGGTGAAPARGAGATAHSVMDPPLASRFQYAFGLTSAATGTDQEIDDYLLKQYADWKARYVVDVNGDPGLKRVQRDPASDFDTVSEGQAYGMLFAVYFDDQPTFDALFRYALQHADAPGGDPEWGGRYQGLMHWMVDKDGVEITEFRVPRSAFQKDWVAWLEVTVEADTGKLFIANPEQPTYVIAEKRPAAAGDKVYLQASKYDRVKRSSATDADVDMAAALIMAARRWGSSLRYGYDYRGRAADFVKAVLAWDVEVDAKTKKFWLRAGNLWGGVGGWNPCYFTPAWWRLFRTFVEENPGWFDADIKLMRWQTWLARPPEDVARPLDIIDGVLTNMYEQLKLIDAKNGTAGLFPDWVDTSSGEVRKTVGLSDRRYYLNHVVEAGKVAYLDDETKILYQDGLPVFSLPKGAPAGSQAAYDLQSSNHYYDAVRVPWRIGMDYLLYGDPTAKAIVTETAGFFRNIREAQAQVDPAKSGIVDGYAIDGGPWSVADKDGFSMSQGGVNESVTFIAMNATAAMVLEDDLANAQAFYKLVQDHQEDPSGKYHYYGSATRLLSLLYMSGRMVNYGDPTNARYPRRPALPATVGPLSIDLAYVDYPAWGTERLLLNDRSTFFDATRSAYTTIGAGLKGVSLTDGTAHYLETGYSTRVDDVLCGLPLLRSRTTLMEGWALARGDVARVGPPVYDTQLRYVDHFAGDPGLMDFTVSAAGFTPGTTAFSVGNGEARPIPPGEHAAVTVGNNGARLTFTGGVYQLASLRTEPGAKLVFDTATSPVVIFIAGDLAIGDRTQFLQRDGVGADASRILIVANGTGYMTIGPQTSWRGTLIAPRAEKVDVNLHNPAISPLLSGDGSAARLDAGGSAYGAFWGRSVEIHQDSAISFVRLDWSAITGMPTAPPTQPLPPASIDVDLSQRQPYRVKLSAPATYSVKLSTNGALQLDGMYGQTFTYSVNGGAAVTKVSPDAYKEVTGLGANATVTLTITPSGPVDFVLNSY